MSLRKSGRFFVYFMFVAVLCLGGYLVYDNAQADHSTGRACYSCHTLTTAGAEQTTSSILTGAAQGVQNTELCEVCHTQKELTEFNPAGTVSRHPVHVTTNQAGYLSTRGDNSPYQAVNANNSIECFNCHNSKQVTKRGDTTPSSDANAYPDHTWEQIDYPGQVSQVAPWDYLENHLYGTEGGVTALGTFYDDLNYNACYGGSPILAKSTANETINTGPTTTNPVFPGCHGTIVDSKGKTIQDYMTVNQGGRKGSATMGHAISADGAIISCRTCHDPHGSTSAIRLYTGPNYESQNFNSVNAICRDCHGYDTGTGGAAPSPITIYVNNAGTAETRVVTAPAPPWVGRPYLNIPHGLESNINSPIEGQANKYNNEACWECHSVHQPPPPPDDVSVECEVCHVWDPTTDNDDVDNYTFGTGDYSDKAMIDATQWTTAGHGVPAGNFMPMTNARWPSNNAFGPELSCADTGTTDGCHDPNVAHGTATNPFRLMGKTGVGTYTNTITKEDHQTGGVQANGPDGVCYRTDGPACHNPDIDTDRHDFNAAYAGGVCFDCHDPHGDSSNADPTTTPIPDTNINAAMIQRMPVGGEWVANTHYGRFPDSGGAFGIVTAANSYPSARYVATNSKSDYYKDNLNYSGICETCHTADGPGAVSDGGSITNYFRRDNGDGDDLSLVNYHDPIATPEQCALKCHLHSKKFEPGGKCIECHASPQGSHPAIVTLDLTSGQIELTADGANGAMSKHVGGSTTGITSFECVICHLEGQIVAGNPEPNSTYHKNGTVEPRDQASGGEIAALGAGGSYTPTLDARGYATNAYLLNANFCGGCHDANGAEWWATKGGNALQPFNNSAMSDADGVPGANDTTTVPDIYSRYNNVGLGENTGGTGDLEGKSSAMYSKFTTANYNVVPQIMKAYSPHGNPSTNVTKSEFQGETPGVNTFVTNPVACLNCHPAHGSDITASGETGYNQLGANGGAMVRTADPSLCWDCHSKPVANVWDFYGDTDRVSANPLQWSVGGGNWTRGTGPFNYKGGYQMRSIHTPANAGGVIACGVCHDPHGIDTANTANEYFLLPSLRVGAGDPGGWVTSPYKEDRPGNKTGSVAPEDPTQVNGEPYKLAGKGWNGPTYADWYDGNGAPTNQNKGTGPRVEPMTSGGSFAYCNPPEIGGGYGDGADATYGGNGHQGFFLNDNTFGTDGIMLFAGKAGDNFEQAPVTVNPQAAFEADGGATGVFTLNAFSGFCKNCHSATDALGIEYGSWTGHHSVFGVTPYNDVYNQSIAQYVHGGPQGKEEEIRLLATNEVGRSSGAGMKWAITQGNFTVGAEMNWQMEANGNKVNYHEFTCSKCHTPHSSVIDRLMRTNCLSGGNTSDDSTSTPGSGTNGPSVIDTTVGNWVDTETTNRAGYTYPHPYFAAVTPTVEAFTMHCHNSFMYVNGTDPGWGMGQTGQNADGVTITYNGGWQKLSANGNDPGGCATIACHSFFPNFAIATAEGSPNSIQRSGAHRVHLDLAFDSTYTSGADPESFYDSDGDGVQDKFGLGDLAQLDCDYCHAYGAGSTPPRDNANAAPHRNGTIEFADAGNPDLTGTTICANCHADDAAAKANWGGNSNDDYTRLACTSCHSQTSPAWTIFGNVRGANVNGDGSNYGFFINGHGLDSGSLYGWDATSLGANFLGDPGTDTDSDSIGDDGCMYCHDITSPHIDANTANGSQGFRFESGNFPSTASVSAVCLDCHERADGPGGGATNARLATDSTDLILDHDSASMSAVPVSYTRLNSSITWGFAPDCNDCHDLHGSTNRMMIGSNHTAAVPPAPDAVNARITDQNEAAWTPNNIIVDYKNPLAFELGKTTAPIGPCITCHRNGAPNGTDHNNQNSVNNDHTHGGPTSTVTSPVVCTDCHKHKKAFAPSACDECHGWPPGYNDPGKTGEAVGSIEQPTLITAPEAGAHLFHTRQNVGTTATPGQPKLDTACAEQGCHVRISSGAATGHSTPDDQTAEVDFDIINDYATGTNPTYPNHAQGDPIIVKDIAGGTGDNSGLGDGSRDRNIGNTLDSGDATGLGTATGGQSDATCTNIYCHSTVVKQASGDWWVTGATPPK